MIIKTNQNYQTKHSIGGMKMRRTKEERREDRAMNKASKECQKACYSKKEYRKNFPIWPIQIIINIKFAVGRMLCKKKGHDFVDESYGGPEGGCMAGYCKRCGYEFYTSLY